MASYYSNQMVQNVTGSVWIDNFDTVVPVTGTVAAANPLAHNMTVALFPASTSSALLSARNPSRKQLWIYATGSDLYIGPASDLNGSYFLKIEAGGFWELPTQGGIYSGELWGVFSGNSGSAQVTEVR